MPILNQDISMLLSSPHSPWEAVRTHMVVLRYNWTPEDHSVISDLSPLCEGAKIFRFRSNGPGGQCNTTDYLELQ